MLQLVLYTDLFIPARFEAYTIGPVVFIRPRSKDKDMGLLQHELTHVKQFWRNPLFGLWYIFSPAARFKYEVEAYRVQLAYCSVDCKPVFARYLTDNYGLDVSFEEAMAALS
jgi:hypothetical protein